MSNIKRGATFKATFLFTENEWAGVYPWDDVMPFVRQESNSYELDYTIDEENFILEVFSDDTSKWKIGPMKLDLWIVKEGVTIPIPNNYSIEMMVIQGGMS